MKQVEINYFEIDLSMGITNDNMASLRRMLKSNVKCIRNLCITGMIYDCGFNLNHILELLNEENIEVGNIDIKAEM